MEKEQIVSLPTEESAKECANSFGKFKTAEELLKAYTSLEGEFTKRSQKLREMEAQAPVRQNWENRVEEFVQEFPIAQNYTDEVVQKINEDKGLSSNGTCLEKALLKVLSEKVKTVDEMANDSEVVTKVASTEAVRDRIIEEYLNKIKEGTPPTVLPSGGAIPIAPAQKPNSINEAGEIAKKIFKQI